MSHRIAASDIFSQHDGNDRVPPVQSQSNTTRFRIERIAAMVMGSIGVVPVIWACTFIWTLSVSFVSEIVRKVERLIAHLRTPESSFEWMSGSDGGETVVIRAEDLIQNDGGQGTDHLL